MNALKPRWQNNDPTDVCALEATDPVALPTRFGEFKARGYRDGLGREHMAIYRGPVEGASGVPIRIHSECLTGDALGSLRCDCRDQLEAALTQLGQEERGVLLYLRQEGRGIGLFNKLRAYRLQEEGLDTVDANLALGFKDDLRDYRVAAQMLYHLDVQSVRVLTNNPEKLRQLAEAGIRVDERIPHIMVPQKHNRHYLETKSKRSGHLLERLLG